MRAGPLRNRVIIQEATQSADSFGQPIETWATKYTVWASINPLTGRERELLGLQSQDVGYRIATRYQANVTPSMRVTWTDREANARTFDIEQVIEPMAKGEQLVLMCREIV